jgi:hypothetical protein
VGRAVFVAEGGTGVDVLVGGAGGAVAHPGTLPINIKIEKTILFRILGFMYTSW